MRPHKLTMSAFGPYAGEQVIDFEQLAGRNLFLITGPTGAGKTTIFDGICYALFGKASGAERESETMRSHFASNDAFTFVELEFSLSGKRYRVKRSPRQDRPKLRGGGITNNDPEAEFKELLDGSITISGVDAVNQKIIATLGISYEQFRQIIMVPQGEFRKLITTGTKEREEIFRKIFGTEQFLLIQNKLFETAKLLEQELKNLQGQIDQTIQRIDAVASDDLSQAAAKPPYDVPRIMDALQKMLVQDETRASELKTELEKLGILAGAKQKEIFQAEENKRKFDARDAAAVSKNQLESREAEIEQKKEIVQRARKADGVKGTEQNYNDWTERENSQQNKLVIADENEANAQREMIDAEKQCNVELQRDPERTELQANQTRLEGLTGKVIDLESRTGKLVDLEQKAKQAETLVESNKKSLETEKGKLIFCQTELDNAKAAAAEYLQQQRELEKVETSMGSLSKLGDAMDQLSGLDEKRCRSEKQLATALESRKIAEAEYEAVRAAFITEQAAYLAASLKEGQPCLVCGSVSHPQPAASSHNLPSEGDLKTLEETQALARADYDKGKQNFDQINGEWQKQQVTGDVLLEGLELCIKEAISQLAIEKRSSWVRDKISYMKKQIRDITQRLDQLKLLKDLEQQLVSDIDTKNCLIEQFDKQTQVLADARNEKMISAQTEQRLVRQLEAELPEKLRTKQALEAEIQRNQVKSQELKAALERAEKAYMTSKLNHAKAFTAKEASQTARDEAGAECVAARDKFFTAITEAGFADLADFARAKLGVAETTEIEAEIAEYLEQLRSACDNYARAEKEIVGIALADMEPIQQRLKAIQDGISDLNQQSSEIFARQKNNRDILKQIYELKNAFEKSSAQYSVANDLAKVAKGDNSQRMSFERYILASYFDEIISAANVRLGKMTAGRYEMRRIDEKGKGGGQFGLELEVVDYYTGKYRHVKTLSGGEGFKASLALALGMADVVQAHAGGVNVDTMFVDEGFGTLDPESLQSAINCLIDLQRSGRLVGIISHVPELKEEIDARLDIQAGTGGSQAQFIIA